MKNFATVVFFVFAISFASSAQQNNTQKNKQKGSKFSTEQQTQIALKRLTLKLDLTEKQQIQLKPILQTQAEKRKATMEKIKIARENNQRPSDEELFAMKNEQLDDQIAMKSKMKEILTKEQYEKFEQLETERKMKGKKMMEERKGNQKE